MPEIELSAGTVEYLDTGGAGEPVVLLHGFLMDTSLWDGVIAELAPTQRCLAPLLPLGAQRKALAHDVDLSLAGIAALVGEFLERLDLHGVTLVGNDTGGAIAQLVIGRPNPRIARAVLASCEAFDNMPPGLPGKTLALAGKLPPRLFGLFMQQLRLRPIRRLPIAFGWLTKCGDAAALGWLQPVLHQPEIRRQAVRAIRTATARGSALQEAIAGLEVFDRPVLVVWASEDRVMPPEHGRRLAQVMPKASFVEVPDSYTLIALDQPRRLAQLIAEFIARNPTQTSQGQA
ncbi:MAG TPA: alpha/beta hydrolase [Acidimicrobiales bacterium]|nr:alpha/beta hydrolase [Acidimicrobiales bacterium]